MHVFQDGELLTAENLNTALTESKAEAVTAAHEIESVEIPLQNSWENYGSGFNRLEAHKTSGKLVTIHGLIRNGKLGSNVGVLPAGFRPARSNIFSVYCGDGLYRRIYIKPDGSIAENSSNKDVFTGYMALDGITFFAA